MSEQNGKPWLDRNAPSDQALSKLLDAGRAERPSAAQLADLARRLGPTFQGPGPGGSGPAGGAAPLSPLPALPLLLAVGAVLGLGAYLAWPDAREPLRATAREPAGRVAPAAPQPAVAERAEPVAGSSAGTPPETPLADASPDATPPARTNRAAREPRPDELTLLAQGQRALRNEPRKALRAMQEHARRFPDGVYAQERELIALEALVRLNARERAQARAANFLERYPSSTHKRRVRALQAQATAAPDAGAPTP